MQQVRAAQPVRRPQVELDGARRRLRLQPGGPLRRRQVAGQRHLRRIGRHLADGVADDELVDDQREPAEHRLGGVEHLGEAGARPPAQGGQRVGEARRRDEVVGRRRDAAPAQGVGGVDEEPRHALGARVGEDVGVPAGADHAGAVARWPARGGGGSTAPT